MPASPSTVKIEASGTHHTFSSGGWVDKEIVKVLAIRIQILPVLQWKTRPGLRIDVRWHALLGGNPEGWDRA